MAVNISGTVLASLLYDQAQSAGHQMGFLTGEVVSHMIDTISDSQINNYERETKIFIYGSVACPRDQRCYNERYEIVPDQLNSLLSKESQNIVGWYSFRRNTAMRPSFKERQIHENLLRFQKQDSNHFLFLLCSSKTTINKSTHLMDHSFSCLTQRGFQRKHVNIINLGDTTHMEYKTLPSHTASSNQGFFSMVVKQQEETFLDVNGHMEVRQIQSLNGALSRKLEDISKDVANSETKLSSLEKEVQLLRKQVRLKTLEEEQKQNSGPVTNASLPKKQSVDDILFMDMNDGKLASSIHDVKSSLVPDSTPSIKISKPHEISQCAEEGGNTAVKGVSEKTEKKVISPVKSHYRSTSVSEDTGFTNDSVNESIASVHVRSKSAEIQGSESKGTTKQKRKEEDPFSFVSSMIELSKQEEDHSKKKKEGKSDTDDSDFLIIEIDRSVKEPATQKQPRNAGPNTDEAKVTRMSTRSRNKHVVGEQKMDDLLSDIDTECETSKDGSSMEVDSSDNDVRRQSKRKTNLIGSKTCSQEVEAVHSDETSQDTYDMDVSSSPIY